jgi:hypothetical protein
MDPCCEGMQLVCTQRGVGDSFWRTPKPQFLMNPEATAGCCCSCWVVTYHRCCVSVLGWCVKLVRTSLSQGSDLGLTTFGSTFSALGWAGLFSNCSTGQPIIVQYVHNRLLCCSCCSCRYIWSVGVLAEDACDLCLPPASCVAVSAPSPVVVRLSVASQPWQLWHLATRLLRVTGHALFVPACQHGLEASASVV